jgi:hypothetical protein
MMVEQDSGMKEVFVLDVCVTKSVDTFVLDDGGTRFRDERVSIESLDALLSLRISEDEVESVTSAERALHGGVNKLKFFCNLLDERKPAGTSRFNCCFVFTSE